MKLYLAGKYAKREAIGLIAHTLTSYGHTVTSRWLVNHSDEATAVIQAEWAAEDLDDIQEAAAAVIFQLPIEGPDASIGRHIEFGYALGIGKPLILVGPKQCVFHHLKPIEWFPTVKDFLEEFRFRVFPTVKIL